MTAEFKQKLDNGATLDDILCEAFAAVREAVGPRARHAPLRRPDDRRHGAPPGRIAEMRTGEGKTLVATLPTYLNALDGKGVHVVTVNDYLAKRDAEWMGRIHGFLGLSTGVDRPRPRRLRAPAQLQRATSRTARTTSSASTTCATT